MKFMVKSRDLDWDNCTVIEQSTSFEDAVKKVFELGRKDLQVQAIRADKNVIIEFRKLKKVEVIEEYSNPFPTKEPKVPGQRVCSKCGKPGHNAKTCGREPKEVTKKIKKIKEPIEQKLLDKYEEVLVQFIKENPGMQKKVLINIIPEEHYLETMTYLLDKKSIRKEGKKRGTKYFA